jgi:predicted Zn finger-like uncharacterized protein
MPISLTCPECESTLRVRDELAGKKVKCPRCAEVVRVPDGEEEVTEVLSPREEGIRDNRRNSAASKPARRRPADEEDEGDEREERVSRDKGGRARPKGGKNDRAAPDVRKRGGKFEPCPRCGAEGATRVVWTPWGSFYGAAMFNQVKCPDCAYQYNGKTGRSNLIPAIIFVTVPLLGILGIIGGVIYVVYSRGYLGK